MSIDVSQTGSGSGIFELAPAAFVDGGDPYIELGAAGEVTNLDTPFYQSNVNVALPVELAAFSVSPDKQGATLTWKTATESNNAGFDIERTAINTREEQKTWIKVGYVEGSGTTNAPKQYTFKNRNVQSGKFAYRLKQIDRDGAFTYSQEVETVIAVPNEFTLSQNYPNPFNPTTTINFSLAEKSLVSIKMYDIMGREVKTIIEGEKDAGYYNVSVDGSSLSSGMYLYHMTARHGESAFTETKRLILMK